MKFSSLIIIVLFAALGSPVAARQNQTDAQAGGTLPEIERRVAAAEDVALSLCLNSGDVIVRGWDRDEVQARASEARSLRLQPIGGQPARRVEVFVATGNEGSQEFGDCGTADSIEISVPRGASVSLTVRNGHTEVSDVADVRVDSFSGDVGVSRVSRSVEISSLSGDVSVANATGRVRLRAVSGGVEAVSLRRADDNDALDVSSTSGDVILRGVNYARVRGSSISGNVDMMGPLSRGGSYELKTISGDVTMRLPADSSFKLNASVVTNGEIVTDFPVKTMAGAMPAPSPIVEVAPPLPPGATSIPQGGMPPPHAGAPPAPGPRRRPNPPQVHVGEPGQTRLVGTVGAGDADVRLTSFNGTLHIKKQ
jgi:hypothetical protein